MSTDTGGVATENMVLPKALSHTSLQQWRGECAEVVCTIARGEWRERERGGGWSSRTTSMTRSPSHRCELTRSGRACRRAGVWWDSAGPSKHTLAKHGRCAPGATRGENWPPLNAHFSSSFSLHHHYSTRLYRPAAVHPPHFCCAHRYYSPGAAFPRSNSPDPCPTARPRPGGEHRTQELSLPRIPPTTHDLRAESIPVITKPPAIKHGVHPSFQRWSLRQRVSCTDRGTPRVLHSGRELWWKEHGCDRTNINRMLSPVSRSLLASR